MPELLQQKQFDLPPPLKVLDEAGKPRKIFEPKQDPTHMEGGKYSEKCLKELAVIRDKVWIDRDTPPKLKLFPSKWYFIQDLESDKDVLEVALNQLRKQEQVIGVALRGKVIFLNEIESRIGIQPYSNHSNSTKVGCVRHMH